jgi:hypothetical protein
MVRQQRKQKQRPREKADSKRDHSIAQIPGRNKRHACDDERREQEKFE